MLRAKGRIVIPRSSKKLTKQEKEANALARAKHKLGENEFKRVKDLITSLSSVGGGDKSVLDGLIMGMLQHNMSNIEIRAVHSFGNSKINRVRKVMNNPKLINSPRPRPSHAVVDKDLENLKAHLATFDTEDGFPCAHRRPRKFFVQQGLHWTTI